MAKQTDIFTTPYLLTDKGNFKITKLSGQPEDEFWLKYQELWQKIIYLSFGIGPLPEKTGRENGTG